MTRIRCDGKGRRAHSQPAVPGLPCCPSTVAATVAVCTTPGDRLATARLYLCTDARRERGDLAEFADAALAGGVDIIQLRDKGSPGEQRFGPLEARDELAALEVLADAARRHGALLAVNDRADIAGAAGADVLHLGQDDLPLPWRATSSVRDTVIGRSTHDRARRAPRSPSRQMASTISASARAGRPRPNRAGPRRPGPGPRHRRTGNGQTVVRDRRHRRTSGCPRCWTAGARRIVAVRDPRRTQPRARATR